MRTLLISGLSLLIVVPGALAEDSVHDYYVNSGVALDGTASDLDQAKIVEGYQAKDQSQEHHGESRFVVGVGAQIYSCGELDAKGLPKAVGAIATLTGVDGKFYGIHGYTSDGKPFWLPFESQTRTWNQTPESESLRTKLGSLTGTAPSHKNLETQGDHYLESLQKGLLELSQICLECRKPYSLTSALKDLLSEGKNIPLNVLNGEGANNSYAYLKLKSKIATRPSSHGVAEIVGSVQLVNADGSGKSKLKKIRTFERRDVFGGKPPKVKSIDELHKSRYCSQGQKTFKIPYRANYTFSGIEVLSGVDNDSRTFEESGSGL